MRPRPSDYERKEGQKSGIEGEEVRCQCDQCVRMGKHHLTALGCGSQRFDLGTKEESPHRVGEFVACDVEPQGLGQGEKYQNPGQHPTRESDPEFASGKTAEQDIEGGASGTDANGDESQCDEPAQDPCHRPVWAVSSIRFLEAEPPGSATLQNTKKACPGWTGLSKKPWESVIAAVDPTAFVGISGITLVGCSSAQPESGGGAALNQGSGAE